MKFNVNDTVKVVACTTVGPALGPHNFPLGTIGKVCSVYNQGTVREYYRIEDATGDWWLVAPSDLELVTSWQPKRSRSEGAAIFTSLFAAATDTISRTGDERYAVLRF